MTIPTRSRVSRAIAALPAFVKNSPDRHAEQDGGQGAVQDEDEAQVRLLPEEEEQEGDDEADLQQDDHGLLLYAYPG